MSSQGPTPTINLAREARFTLGGLEIRPPTRELVAGGVAEVLEPRIMQVLITLARRRGQVVSRDDLITTCWGGRAVGEDAINRCIQAIRRIAQVHGGFAVTTVTRVGYRLDESALPFAKAAPVQVAPDTLPATAPRRERRHMTALACRLVLPGIAPRLDPEEWHDLVTAYRGEAAATTKRFGGYLADGRGERLVIYFGYPDALEDAAERAVRTGLAIIEAIAALSARLALGSRPQLSVRIGVHAGVVVVARHPAGAVELFGEAPDIAALIQAQAAPGAVVMTGRVGGLVSSLFTLEPCGALALDGADPPMPLIRAMAPDPETGRGSARRAATLVGREDEAHLLSSRWRRVQGGDGQLVLLTGEPGIGKTRLMEAFQQGLQDGTQVTITCRCAQLFANSPFYAVNQMLRQSLGWRGDEPSAQRFEELERTLETAGLKLGETVPLIADLLNLPIPERYAPTMLPPDQKRKRLLAALVDWVFAVTRRGPLLVIAEDLHWIDPSSLEVLQTLVEQGATAPLMLLCTARPEFRAPWPARAHHTQLTLNRLGDRDMRALVGGLANQGDLAGPVLDAVIQRADGVPLFAEELMRLMQDAGGQADGREVPETLRDSLAARLDRLDEAKVVAQLGAILGRDFTYELLHAVSPMPEAELQAALTRLADAELIYVRGLPPEARYQFKHALIQDAAYAALPRDERRALHGAVARVITTRAGAETRPEVLARHWSEAGEDDKAITAWTQAATEAGARRAFQESAACYRQALGILKTQPESPTRDLRELDLGLAFIPVLQSLTGPHTAEAAAAAARTRVLAEKGGFVGATTGMRAMAWNLALTSADWPQASALADQMVDFAQQVGNAEPAAATMALALSHVAQLNTRMYRGDLEGAEAHFEPWRLLHEAEGFDQRMTTTPMLCNAGSLAFYRGHADLARARGAQAIAWSLKANSPYEYSLALGLNAMLQVLLRAPEAAEARAVEALELARPGGFQQVIGWATVFLGWARAQGGATEGGLATMAEGLATLADSNSRVSLPLILALQAQVMALNGAHDDAFATLEQALTVNPEERVSRPIILIHRGELLAHLGQTDQALTSFNGAVVAARSIGGRTFELRATVGQARLLRARGGAGEARDRLAGVFGGFTEGFDTPDLIEAKALLDELQP